MKTYQFYTKQDVLVHLDIDGESYKEEKKQLVAQGFNPIGDLVQAEDAKQAFKNLKSYDLDDLVADAKLHTLAGGIILALG
ncbi:hypothetical protein CS022_13980 [Veronia nyctiphanis]|uniref:Uncharacterized protein n=1 Tax=Veronia nyctiphanis TaxID=1278244 RepID=A0A4Q0YP15_9GAMM|nr:hypothetical protein [Veronia nyctiphanis]RXJ72740.1 hypothetical protein CS022_13980 [Veronia nyctiphanis]